MPQGIVWFKIRPCYKLQQVVVGFFEVDFYSRSTFTQLPPLSPPSFLVESQNGWGWKGS